MSVACSPTDPGRFWLRLRPRIELAAALVACLIFASAAQPQPEAHDTAKDGGAAALDRFLTEVQSFTADFEQRVWTADEVLVEATSGTLALKRPNRFRWHYAEPMEQLMVTNGRRLWMYDVDLAQVTVAPVDETAGSSPLMLLSGDRDVREGFDFIDEFEWDDLEWVRLAPQLQGTEFSAVLVGFRDGSLERLELVDEFEQTTRIDFVNVSVNPDLNDDLFEFEAPPGVDVLGASD